MSVLNWRMMSNPSPKKMNYYHKGKAELHCHKQTRHRKKERQIALQQEVDKLERKLKHEKSVRRALQRALNRPLGSLPRLPSYLPHSTMKLLAEVAVSEEEVVMLEKQFDQLRQCLYEEAISLSLSKEDMTRISHIKETSAASDKLKTCKSLSSTRWLAERGAKQLQI